VRSVEDIKADIDQVAQYRRDIIDGIPENLYELPDEMAQRYMHIMHWMSRGEESVFLQDANTVVLTFDKLREILVHLRKTLPNIKRVTTYGRVDSLDKFTAGQLKELKEAGLGRIHSGYESGSDEVLALISKGYTKAQEIEAGQKIKASGIELSIYFMPGIGGKTLSDSNAIETADVVNKVNPDFVRIRTFVSQRGTEIYDEINLGLITECTDKEKMLELKKMIEHIDRADGVLISDHIINLFDDVSGNMSSDKSKMLSVFEAFESLRYEDQRKYQLARRMGMVRSLRNMSLLTKDQLNTVNSYLEKLDTTETFEAFLSKLLRRYV